MDFEPQNTTLKRKKRLFSDRFLFITTLFIFIFLIIWILLDYWQDKQGGDINLVHETIGLTFCFIGIIRSYLIIYRKADVIKQKKLAKIKAANDAKNQKARVAFISAIEKLKNTDTESKEKSIEQLLTIGLATPDYRQACINGLSGLNTWMIENKNSILKENLVSWRLKKTPIEGVDVPMEKQQTSLKAIIVIEKIIKKHCEDYKNNLTDKTIDLCGKCIPALNLGFTHFPENSINFNFGLLWECSFWGSSLETIDFTAAELEKSNFWKSTLNNVNFENTRLKEAKLKTDLTNVINLTASQFFNTNDWAYNKLTEEQIESFFPVQEFNDLKWEKWSLGEPERKKMYK